MSDCERVRACLAFDDNMEAFNCIKEVIRHPDPDETCRPRLALFTRPSCHYCAEEKASLAQELAEGTVCEIDISTPEGKALAQKNAIEYIPAVVPLDCNGAMIEGEGAGASD